MKTAMYLSGRLKCDAVRKPIKKPSGEAYQKIQSAVKVGQVFNGEIMRSNKLSDHHRITRYLINGRILQVLSKINLEEEI